MRESKLRRVIRSELYAERKDLKEIGQLVEKRLERKFDQLLDALEAFALTIDSTLQLTTPEHSARMVARMEELAELLTDRVPHRLSHELAEGWSFLQAIPMRDGKYGAQFRFHRLRTHELMMELLDANGMPVWRRVLAFEPAPELAN